MVERRLPGPPTNEARRLDYWRGYPGLLCSYLAWPMLAVLLVGGVATLLVRPGGLLFSVETLLLADETLVLSIETRVTTDEALAHHHQAEVTSLLNRYYSLHGTGLVDEAGLALREVLAIEPNNALALRGLGYHYQNQGRDREAAEAFRSAAYADKGAALDTMLMSTGYAYQVADLDTDADTDGRRVSNTRLKLINSFDF